MSKRKKLRTSGEGINPLKPPKNPRLRDSHGVPQSSELCPLHHPEESEGRSGPAPSVEQRGEEPGQAASSSPDKETGSSSMLLGQPERESVSFPSSQNSVGRFVPQFAKPRKTVTRQAATREEDLGSGAFGLETLPEPSVQPAGSQSWEESPGLTVREAREPGDQTQAGGTCSEHVCNPVTLVSSRAGSQSEVSNDASPARETVALASERASQHHLLEQGTNLPDGGSRERGGVPGARGQKGLQPSSDAEEKEPGGGAPQEEDAHGGAGADQEEGDSILATWDPEPRSVAQGPPHLMQTLSRAGCAAEGSYSSPGRSSLMTIVLTDMSTDTTKPKQRALGTAGPGGQVNARMPASLSGEAPAGGHRGALLRGVPFAGETVGGRGEAGGEAKPPGDVPGGPALAHGIQEPTTSAGGVSPVASEMGPSVAQTQVPGRDQEGLGGSCAMPLPSQPSGEKAAELGSQSQEQDLGGLSLSLGASALPMHREAVDSPPPDAKASQGSPDALEGLVGQPNRPDSEDQDAGGMSPAMELDFLPDSQIQDALEAPDIETPLEQLFPAGSGLGPCWAGTRPLADGSHLTKAQPSAYEGLKPCEAPRMEDATDTVRGLVIELSNLNRLIMTTHRDLEAFKRLNYWKAKPVVKAPLPHTSKGAGTVPHGEPSWKGL
ncbi:break repair meiotic recombinase recruitment factor 1 [Rhinolophus ferrumequinum]|uniref:break repair meiotic recombinase recruitment factor 1 n=1 Tax=Rhinolophus ferrumequinum TaxID=59479 RepID=UPI00140FA8A5|nr:break repair meiotic recombinase recruitment factor 1 [Rhinolophus ferrumequinum]